jgi:hypothetical protein
VSITDQDENQIGAIRSLNLNILGTEIIDTDSDGLDDEWEMTQFGNLASTAKEDPDDDGAQNAREQLLGTSPLISDLNLEMNLDFLDKEHIRLSWQSRPNHLYEVISLQLNGNSPDSIGTVRSRSYRSEWVVKLDKKFKKFFQVIERAE